jgi:hypothetical protein
MSGAAGRSPSARRDRGARLGRGRREVAVGRRGGERGRWGRCAAAGGRRVESADAGAGVRWRWGRRVESADAGAGVRWRWGTRDGERGRWALARGGCGRRRAGGQPRARGAEHGGPGGGCPSGPWTSAPRGARRAGCALAHRAHSPAATTEIFGCWRENRIRRLAGRTRGTGIVSRRAAARAASGRTTRDECAWGRDRMAVGGN